MSRSAWRTDSRASSLVDTRRLRGCEPLLGEMERGTDRAEPWCGREWPSGMVGMPPDEVDWAPEEWSEGEVYEVPLEEATVDTLIPLARPPTKELGGGEPAVETRMAGPTVASARTRGEESPSA